jgi:hypothetical protein
MKTRFSINKYKYLKKKAARGTPYLTDVRETTISYIKKNKDALNEVAKGNLLWPASHDKIRT